MEGRISGFGKTLTSFCNHLQSSCDALKLSLDRRPIPLDSASSTFIQCVNRGVSTVSADLNVLESMSFGTVSFEELLGHCNEVYKQNNDQLVNLQLRLQSFGYVPAESEDEDEKCRETKDGSVSAATCIVKSIEDDPLMDESLSLKSLGLSDVCLATLASEANSKIDDDWEPIKHYGDEQSCVRSLDQISVKSVGVNEDELEGDLKLIEDVGPSLELSKDDYDVLPSYMKSLASWEDMLAATEKINSSLRKKEKTKGSNYFHQEEIASLGLGPKARTYLLLLMRMNQLVVETIDGLISYKVLPRK